MNCKNKLPLPLPADNERDKVILMPIGHTEQHGFHLPLSVDTVIIEAIAQGTATAIPDQAFTLPVMPYGVSTHRSSFAATMNAGGRAFEDFWLAVIDVLVARGFDRFYLMSGHGGNSSFLVNVVEIRGRTSSQDLLCDGIPAYVRLNRRGGDRKISNIENRWDGSCLRIGNFLHAPSSPRSMPHGTRGG